MNRRIIKVAPGDLQAGLQFMQEYPPGEVEKDYRLGKITLRDKLDLLQSYGIWQREAAVQGAAVEAKQKTGEVTRLGGGPMGEVKFYVQNVAKEFKGAWDAAQDDKAGAAVMRGLMGSLQLLNALDVPGDAIERWIVEAYPESPGYARAANWAAWTGFNFFGITALLKAPFKAGQSAAKALQKGGAALSDELAYLKDPVAHAVRQGRAMDAMHASQLARRTARLEAEQQVLKNQIVTTAAMEGEARATAGPTIQAMPFQTAKPATSFQEFEKGFKTVWDEHLTELKAVERGNKPAFYSASQDRAAMAYAQNNKDLKIFDNVTPDGDFVVVQNTPAGLQRAKELIDLSQQRERIFKRGDEIEIEDWNKAFSEGLGYEPELAENIVGKAGQGPRDLEAQRIFSYKQQEQAAIAHPPPQIPMASPQDIERMTVKEMIQHYEVRSREVIRSSTEPFEYAGVSHAQTRAAASAKPIDFDEIAKLGPDQDISASKFEAIRRTHEAVLDGFHSIVEEAGKHIDDIRAGNRPDLVEAYKAHLAAAEITTPGFLGARGQSGRLQQYMSSEGMQDVIGESLLFDKLTRGLNSEKLLEGNHEAIAYQIQQVLKLSKKGREELLDKTASRDYTPGTTRLLYKSLLFANPATHVVNMTGNTVSILANAIQKSGAAASPMSSVSIREAAAHWSGLWESRKKLVEFARQASEKQGESLSKAGIEGGSLTGTLVTKGPLGWLGFEDEFMAGILGNGMAKGRATVEAMNKWDELQEAVTAGAFTFPPGTKKNKWISDYVDGVMGDPENYKRLVEEAAPEIDKVLFRSPLSEWGEDIARGIRRGPFDYFLPVLKFPINSMKMARDWTPGLQMISKEFIEAVAAGGAKADAARARMALSWMVADMVFGAAKMGHITGGGPLNPEANRIWREATNPQTGKQNVPYAINGVPIRWAEPWGTVIGFAADMAHGGNTMAEDSLMSGAGVLLHSIYRMVENNYFLRIVEGLTNAVEDVTQVGNLQDMMHGAAKFLALPVKAVVGGGPVGRRVGEMMNPTVPDTRAYGESPVDTGDKDADAILGEISDIKTFLFAGTPWGADSRPALNYSGRVKVIPPVLGQRWLSFFAPPLRMAQDGNDPAATILDKHGLKVHDNWKYYGGTSDPDQPLEPTTMGKPRVDLNGDQAYNWKSIALGQITNRKGQTWVQALEALDADPKFRGENLDDKQSRINNLYGDFRSRALDVLRSGDPSIKAKELKRDALEREREGRPGVIHEMFGIEKEVAARPQILEEEAGSPAPSFTPEAPVTYAPMEPSP